MTRVRGTMGLGTTLDESMEHSNGYDPRSWGSLFDYLRWRFYFLSPTEENITIVPYGRDERIGWDTHLVCVDGRAALYMNGPLYGPKRFVPTEGEP